MRTLTLDDFLDEREDYERKFFKEILERGGSVSYDRIDLTNYETLVDVEGKFRVDFWDLLLQDMRDRKVENVERFDLFEDEDQDISDDDLYEVINDYVVYHNIVEVHSFDNEDAPVPDDLPNPHNAETIYEWWVGMLCGFVWANFEYWRDWVC